MVLLCRLRVVCRILPFLVLLLTILLAVETGSGDVNESYVVDLLTGLQNAGLGVQPKIKAVYDKFRAYEAEKLEEINKQRGWYLGHITPGRTCYRKLIY